MSFQSITPPAAPTLAPPGAGLPAPERFIANLMVKWQAARTSRGQAVELFAAQRAAALEVIRDVPSDRLHAPVLIRRLRGLEDSSRYWSVLMTLDHLRIVNEAISQVIPVLAAGQVPVGVASTAAVKPAPDQDHSVIAAFEKANDALVAAVAAVADLQTSARYPHPWFGPLNAAQWHFMAGFHLRLHVNQLRLIVAGLAV